MSTPRLNLRVVLSDARRIIKANAGHFAALGLLFVLPLSFSAIVYPSLLQPTSVISIYNRLLSSSSTTVPEGETPPSDEESDVVFTLVYYLFVLAFSLFTTASITHSTWNGFFGRPLKITSSLKSTLASLLPLAATYVVYQAILGLILIGVGGLLTLLYGGILFLGAQIDYGNVYFVGLLVLMTLVLVGVMVYIQVEWFLASVVVVVESKWGFETLKRSSYLINGMKWIAFGILIYFALSIGVLSGLYSSSVPSFIRSGGISWDFGLLTVLFTFFVTALMLYSVAATTVLFIYCKALCGELALEMADDFAPLYVRLPFDGDEKAPKVVYVV
ncbi:hypothetical protein F511_22598 [Dorcoceras hygrometricum]|uniref:Uncharacterized protein n=1 Tax=Dorcoceras hygrometricum TaxID=472368 RepID=A0A2Z7BK31_9LAMI|nr:hypothetical protein F511_22598 [Dorcoceras hygrometricum]